jgi:hypothetical protein
MVPSTGGMQPVSFLPLFPLPDCNLLKAGPQYQNHGSTEHRAQQKSSYQGASEVTQGQCRPGQEIKGSMPLKHANTHLPAQYLQEHY